MAEVEAASAAEVLAGLPRDAEVADVADRLRSLHSWLYEPRLVTRTLARLAASQASTALQVLNYMQSQEIEPNAFHYTAVIAGCARSGSWRVVGSLLQQMVEEQIQRDSVTFNSAINACGKSAQWETSVSLLKCMVDSNLTLGTDTMNSVMGACTAAGQWERALWIFGTTLGTSSPDVITFCSALAACDKGSQWRRSLQVLASSASSSVQLDNFAYSAVISACATAERWEFACGLLENLGKKAVLADLVTHGAILKALGAGKEWTMALALFFDRTNDEPSEATQVTCNSVISACSTGSKWQHACLLLNSMPDLGVSPEDVSYNTAISACVRGQVWQQGLMLFDQMHQALVEPDHISFNSALSACHKGSQWQLSLTLLVEMSECSLEPDEFCVTTALSACELAGWQLCLQVLWKLQRRTDVTPIMFGVLMSACERDSAWAAALATLDAIISDDLIPDALHAGSAANALRKCQGPEAALELLEQMKELWSDAWATAEQFPGKPRWEASSKIIHVGQGVVACFKPAGIATEVFVEDLADEVAVSGEAFSIVSRLDHPTSGILMVALGLQGSPAANWLQVQFASRLVDKKYICLCEGSPLGSVGDTGNIFTPLAADEVRDCMVVPEAGRLGRESWTKYRILARYTAQEASPYELMLLEVKPITGRTHQIRVHMAHVGRPLVGDLTYGAKELSILPCERLFLHCRRVQLRDFSDQKFCAVASLPVELRQVLAKLQPMSAASGRKSGRCRTKEGDS